MQGDFPLIKSIKFQASLADRRWKDPPKAALRVCLFYLPRPLKKWIRITSSRIERFGPVRVRPIKWSHDSPRDFSSSCLKERISIRRSSTLEIGKYLKIKLLYSSFQQSPSALPMLSLYQCLAFPVKENGKSFYLRVSSDMPSMRRRSQIRPNSSRCVYGFSSPSPEKGWFWRNSMYFGLISKLDVMIGFEDFGGSRCMPVGLLIHR